MFFGPKNASMEEGDKKTNEINSFGPVKSSQCFSASKFWLRYLKGEGDIYSPFRNCFLKNKESDF